MQPKRPFRVECDKWERGSWKCWFTLSTEERAKLRAMAWQEFYAERGMLGRWRVVDRRTDAVVLDCRDLCSTP